MLAPQLRYGFLAFGAAVITLLLTVFEGALRKWYLAGASDFVSYVVYLSKDIVFALILCCRAVAPMSPHIWVFRRFLLFGGVAVLAGAIISSVQGVSPVGAFLTLRSMVLMPAIACVAVSRLPAACFKVILWLAIICTIGNAVLGVVQNRLPADHWINQYAVNSMQVVALESGVRATGTFAYITGLAVISTLGVWAGLLLLSSSASFISQIAGWSTIAAGVVCGLASVSRAPIVIDAAMVLLWGLLARLRLTHTLTALAAATAVLVYAAAGGLLEETEQLSTQVIERQAAGEDDFTDRAFGQTEEMFEAAVLAPLGNGLGFEQVGGNFFSTGNLTFANFESQFPRVVMDTTVIGLAGYIIMCLGALWALQLAKRTADHGRRAVLTATQLFLASIFYASEVYNHTASSFAWIIFAAVMAGVSNNPRPASSVGI